MKIVKLNTSVADRVTSLQGVLTHAYITINHRVTYLFKPRGLNTETGHPLKGVWVSENRLKVVDECQEIDERKIDLLGKDAECGTTGFRGMITGLMIHQNGCVHAEVSPKDLLKSGEMVECTEIDIRNLVGHGIPTMSKKEREESTETDPSPASHSNPHPSCH